MPTEKNESDNASRAYEKINMAQESDSSKLDLDGSGLLDDSQTALNDSQISFLLIAAKYKLPNLEYLDLSNNQLSELPHDIASFQNLKILDLSNNQFSELPAEIVNLPNLEYLYLNDNNLLEVPAIFNKLEKIQILELRNNKISELSLPLVKQLQNIHELYVNHNPLTENTKKLLRISFLQEQVIFNESQLIEQKDKLSMIKQKTEKNFVQIRKNLRDMAELAKLKMLAKSQEDSKNINRKRGSDSKNITTNKKQRKQRP